MPGWIWILIAAVIIIGILLCYKKSADKKVATGYIGFFAVLKYNNQVQSICHPEMYFTSAECPGWIVVWR